MSQKKMQKRMRNLALRRTLYRLMLAAPALPMVGCNVERECPRPTETWQNVRLEDGSIPPPGTSCSDCCTNLCLHEFSMYPATSCSLTTPEGGTSATLVCNYSRNCSNDGRRPEGLSDPDLQPATGCPLGILYAQMGHLEAASVPAFLRLAEELAAHHAPDVLMQSARRAAGDEVRHARAVGALARAHGAAVPDVNIAPFMSRSLEAMVVENAVEGCVRETFGAMVTGWQARTAGDEEVRQALAPIFADEIRHAELAWAVDAWAALRLSVRDRAHVREARHQALFELERQMAAEEPLPALVHQAGVPSRVAAQHLLAGLSELVTRTERA